MVHVAPSRSLLLFVAVQRMRGGHQVLDDVREPEVALVVGLKQDIVVEAEFFIFFGSLLKYDNC